MPLPELPSPYGFYLCLPPKDREGQYGWSPCIAELTRSPDQWLDDNSERCQDPRTHGYALMPLSALTQAREALEEAMRLTDYVSDEAAMDRLRAGVRIALAALRGQP